MLSIFYLDGDSKSLYFKLNNTLHNLSPSSSATYKIAGIYAIYKDGVCYYVGQSKNLSSRISTHLSGKYKNADCVKVFFAGEFDGEYDCDFYSWSKDDQTRSLQLNEALCIRFFRPVENIYIPELKSERSDWAVSTVHESATIDIDDGVYCVYRDENAMIYASKRLSYCYENEIKSIVEAQNGKS